MLSTGVVILSDILLAVIFLGGHFTGRLLGTHQRVTTIDFLTLTQWKAAGAPPPLSVHLRSKSTRIYFQVVYCCTKA